MKKIYLILGILSVSLYTFSQQVGTGNATVVDKFNATIPSGFYYTEQAQPGYLQETPEWRKKHLIVSRSFGSTFQISTTVWQNDRVFFRKINHDVNNPNADNTWQEFATRGANTFTGKQVLNGHAYVNGIVFANEVRVETTRWADFVFDADYKLPALSEVKAHIEEHKQLPGIPSEAEVKENGIALSEATTLLLQKIEELTLYVIQQHEKLEKQEQEIESLKVQMQQTINH